MKGKYDGLQMKVLKMEQSNEFNSNRVKEQNRVIEDLRGKEQKLSQKENRMMEELNRMNRQIDT